MTAIRCAMIGYYMGIRTGMAKTGNPWSALQFRCDEIYKGMELKSEQLTQPNVSVFDKSVESGCDITQLLIGQKYQLNVAVETSTKGANWRLIAFKSLT